MKRFLEMIQLGRLSFDDREAEKAYQSYIIRKSIRWFRFALISGVFFYLSYIVVDFIAYPSIAFTFMLTRFALMFPVVLIVVGSFYLNWYLDKAMTLNIIAVILAGFGVILLTIIGRNEPTINRNFVGIIVAFFYTYNFLRIRFLYCSIIGTSLMFTAIFVEFFVVEPPFAIFLSNSFFLIMSNFIGMLVCYVLEFQFRKEYLLLNKVKDMSIRDSLTGLYNRHYYKTIVEIEMTHILKNLKSPGRRMTDNTSPESPIYGLFIIDLDHFKKVNDDYGHVVGDQVLQEVSKLLAMQIRAEDHLIRWGGEEFLVVLANTYESYLKEFMMKVGNAIMNHHFDDIDETLNITCSIGGVNIPFGMEPNIEKIISVADSALYDAKENGRNQGCLKLGHPSSVESTSVIYSKEA